jgi:N-acylneuraminate cytidylyltransferase
MTVDAFIPIKSDSERIPRKNFHVWKSRPLYTWIIDKAVESGSFRHVYVRTDSTEVAKYAERIGCRLIHLTEKTAQLTGNQLLVDDLDYSDADWLFQLFCTAPNLSIQTIRMCVYMATAMERYHDSIFTVIREQAWFWLDDLPLYNLAELPRSQDSKGLWKETTGLYGIRRDALERYRQRIGVRPQRYEVDPEEAVDIDWPQDLERTPA